MTTPYFIGSPCSSVSYYNYICVWPYYIVIQYIIITIMLWVLSIYSFNKHYTVNILC